MLRANLQKCDVRVLPPHHHVHVHVGHCYCEHVQVGIVIVVIVVIIVVVVIVIVVGVDHVHHKGRCQDGKAHEVEHVEVVPSTWCTTK